MKAIHLLQWATGVLYIIQINRPLSLSLSGGSVLGDHKSLIMLVVTVCVERGRGLCVGLGVVCGCA